MKRPLFFILRERYLSLCLILLLSGCLSLLFCVHFLLRGAGPAAVDADAPRTAENDAPTRHLLFLRDCGWSAEGPVSVTELQLPSDFGAVYTVYNRLQQAQGFDLRPFAGKTVQKYVYTVANDPAAATDETVYANVLEADGRIVGGDISTTAIDGFMHGFHGETDGYDQTG